MIKNESFDYIFKALPISAVLLKPDLQSYQISAINAAYINCLGISQKNYVGEGIKELYGYIPKNVDSAEFLNILIDSLNEVFETQQIKKTRQEVYYYQLDKPSLILKKLVDIEITPIINSAGELLYLLQTLNDVTETEKTKLKIESLNHQFKDLVNSIEGIFWEANAETFGFTYISPQVKYILGYTQEEWLSEPDFWQKHLYTEDVDLAINYCKQQTQLKKNHTFEYRIHKANGDVIWVKDMVTVVVEKNKPVLLRGIILDINDIKTLELKNQEITKKLINRNEFIDSILANIPIGIAVTDLNSDKLSIINKPFTDIIGWNENEIKQFAQIFDKTLTNQHQSAQIRKNLNKSFLNNHEEALVWKNISIITQKKEEKNITIRNIPLKDQNLLITTVRDTTLQNKYLADLEATKTELSRIMEHSADLICTTDESGHFVLVSNASERILGYKPEELKGKTTRDLINESNLEESISIGSKIREGMEMKNFQVLCNKKDGTTIPLLWSARWIEKEKRYYCICKDATEKFTYETKLLASEKKYKNLFDNNPVPMLIWDIETLKILDCNDEASLLYGYSKQEFLNLIIQDIKSESEFLLLSEKIKNKTIYTDLFRALCKHKKKNGELIDVEINRHLIDYHGRKVALVTTLDITDRVKLEKAQQFEKRDKEALINNTNQAIWSIDTEFKLIAANHAFLKRIKENTKKDFKPGDILIDEKLFATEFLDLWKNLYQEALAGNALNRIITSKHPEDGSISWFEISLNPIINENKISGVACRYSDITQQKTVEEQIRRSEENLAEAQKITKLGSWEIDLVNNTVLMSDELYRILDLDKTNDNIYPSFLFDMVDEKHKSLKKESNLEAIKSGKSFNIEFNITTAKGEKKILKEAGYGKKSNDGVVYKLFGTVQDITTIKNLELQQKELLTKQQLLFAIVSSSEDAIISKTLAGNITSWNKGAENMFGYTESEMLAQHISVLIPKNLIEQEQKIITAIQNGKQNHHFETIRKHKNGRLILVSLTISPIFNSEGKIIGISKIVRDISEKKKAQIALIKAYKEKENILESIGDSFFTVDKNWVVTYWNKEAENELHVNKENIVGKKLFDVFAASADSLSAKKYNEALETNTSIHFTDYHPITKKYFDVSVYPSENGLSVYFKNVTEEKKIQQQFEAVTRNMPGITYRCKLDKEWTMLFLSDGLKEITGYTPDELTNNRVKSFSDIIHPDDVDGTYIIEANIHQKKVFHIHYRIICKNNQVIWVENIGRGIFDNEGELEFIDGVILDITQRKNDENKLKKLNKELENKAAKLKVTNNELEQFAYVASHDLQEPLRMVSSFLTLLKNKYHNQLDEEGGKFIFFAVDGAQRMRKIILDLLEFSRVGKTKNNKEKVDLNLMMENISHLFIKQINAKQAKIIFKQLPTLHSYQTPIQQVFTNLIGNALKYGASEINISFKENKLHWQFAVADNGIGINEKYFEKIFVIFQRLHNKDEYSGTGIGLAITKKIVEGFGGKIWVQSEENKGSTFYFTILKNS